VVEGAVSVRVCLAETADDLPCSFLEVVDHEHSG